MIYVINRPELLALEFYKSRPFKGSDKGIRYMIQKDVVEIEPEGEKDQTDEGDKDCTHGIYMAGAILF